MTGSILKVGEKLLLDRIVSNEFPFTGKSKVGVGMITLSAILFAISIGFFIYGSYLWMSANMPPEAAAMYTAGLAMFLSLSFGCFGYLFIRYRREKVRRMRSEIQRTLYETVGQADNELALIIQENPKTAMLMSSLAGFMVAEKSL